MPETSTTDSLRLVNVQIDDLLTMGVDAPIDLDEQGSAPATPSSGKVRLYAKSDGKPYIKGDGGAETSLDAATAGAAMKSLFDAYTILAADTDDTPAAVSLALGELIGRGRSSGGIVALDSAKLLDILSTSWAYKLLGDTWYDGTPMVGGANTATSIALAANRLYAIPFWCPKETTWVRIGINVDVADAGKKLKLGVYDDADGVPNSRLLESSEFTLDATGDKEETISLSLDAGLHYLAVRSDSDTAKLFRHNRGDLARVLGASGLTAAAGTFYYTATGTYAANGIPAAWPGGTTIATSVSVFASMLKTGATP